MKIFTFIIFLAISLTAHASDKPKEWRGIKGSLTRLSDGEDLPFEIEKRFGPGTARMKAYNPKTKEVFNGTYNAITQGGGFERSPVYDKYSNPLGSVTTAKRITGANAQGILRGDKGTIIRVQMAIQPGNLIINPKGNGDGSDNKGQDYFLQF